MGIDPSLTKTAVMVIGRDGSRRDSTVVRSENQGLSVSARMSRIKRMVNGVMVIVQRNKPVAITLEHYSFGSNTGLVCDLAEYGGNLRFALIKHGYVPIEVAPTTLKKWVTGSGGGDKVKVISSLTRDYGVMFGTDDEYDAYGLARMALQIAKFEEPVLAYQREAIAVAMAEKVRKERKTKKKASQ